MLRILTHLREDEAYNLLCFVSDHAQKVLAPGNAFFIFHAFRRETIDHAQDAAAGEKVFVQCKTCHQMGETAKNAVGPVLNGLIGRKAGTVPGYAVFNFDTSYEVSKGFTLFAQVTNLFDRKYYTAGALGVNPVAPSMRTMPKSASNA